MEKAVFSDSLNVTLFNQNSFTDVNEKEVLSHWWYTGRNSKQLLVNQML